MNDVQLAWRESLPGGVPDSRHNRRQNYLILVGAVLLALARLPLIGQETALVQLLKFASARSMLRRMTNCLIMKSFPALRCFRALVLGLGLLALGACASAEEQKPAKASPTPVILDTDIGDDIDDTWALGLLLRSPELELKLVVGDRGEAQYRARLLARLLERAGRSDVPVGVGLDIEPRGEGRQAAWVKDYDLGKYPGKVHADGVQALIDVILKSPQPVTLICIGPVPNIAEALKREPRIGRKARFVGMHGSVRVGYGGAKQPHAEWNVKCDAKACQAVFTAPWEMTITPLDTCGLVTLTGEKYRRVRDSQDCITGDIMANYRIWVRGDAKLPENMADERSSTLFDTVAIYLAMRQDLCVIEKLGIRVTDDGMTVIDPKAKGMSVATSWKDLGGFEDFLVERLTGAGEKGARPSPKP